MESSSSSSSSVWSVLSIEDLERLLARAKAQVSASRGSVYPADCVVVSGSLVSSYGIVQLCSSSLSVRAVGTAPDMAVDVSTGVLARYLGRSAA